MLNLIFNHYLLLIIHNKAVNLIFLKKIMVSVDVFVILYLQRKFYQLRHKFAL
jgi:hypothetical protein